MVTVDYTSLLTTTVVVFIGSWLLLFLLSYFLTPFYTKYGDQKSRVIYSAIYSLAFAVIVGIGYGLMPVISQQYGFWPTMLIALVIVLILTVLQNYIINMLVDKGMLKMARK
jgi:Na+-driven multidrug efflux pump